MMPTTGFEPVKGKQFTFQTTPAVAWDGVIRCQVLEVMPNERLVYSWKNGHEGNVGYGSRLDTVDVDPSRNSRQKWLKSG